MKLLFLCAGFAVSLFGLLPPLAQSARELEAIFADPQVGKLQSGNAISSVLRLERGYVLTTSSEKMFVEVEYFLHSMVGPAKFHLVFHDPMPISE